MFFDKGLGDLKKSLLQGLVHRFFQDGDDVVEEPIDLAAEKGLVETLLIRVVAKKKGLIDLREVGDGLGRRAVEAFGREEGSGGV